MLFAASTIAQIPGQDLPVNVPFLQTTTIAVLMVAFVVGFLVTLVDNSWTDVSDVTGLLAAQEAKLEQGFNELGEGE